MRFPSPLVRGRLLRRYKRFLADVVLDGDGVEPVVAHCANSGSMLGCAEPGSSVWLREHDDPSRKLRYSWELVQVGRALVGVNTALPNRIVREALERRRIAALAGYREIRPEVRIGERGSRLDFLLTGHDGRDGEAERCWVEVKNVTLADRPSRTALFPDAVTARGTRHVEELAELAAGGDRAVMLFVVNRADCDRLRPADHIDPAYGRALRGAARAGVELLAVPARVRTTGITLRPTTLPVVLD